MDNKHNGVYESGELDFSQPLQPSQDSQPQPTDPQGITELNGFESVEPEREIITENKVIDYEAEKQKKKIGFWYIVWNVISVLGYVIFLFVSMKLDYGGDTFHTIMIISLIVYVLIFVLLLAFSRDKSKLSMRLKNYKSFASVINKGLRIYNLVLSVGLLVQSIRAGNINSLFSILSSIGMLLLIVAGIIFDILTILFRKRFEYNKKHLKELIKSKKKEFRE